MEVLKRTNNRPLADIVDVHKMFYLIQKIIEILKTPRKIENQTSSFSPKGKHDSSGNHNDIDAKQLQHCKEIVGEIALQLEQRILYAVFQEKTGPYNFSVSEIERKIIQVTSWPSTKEPDERQRAEMTQRYHDIMIRLKTLGYDKHVHPDISWRLVNTYGILDDDSRERACYTGRETLLKIVRESIAKYIMEGVDVLFNCLNFMSEEDGKPFFI